MVKSITIFIPAYNESCCLYDTTIKIVNYFKKKEIDYEILLLNDASLDKTLDIMKILSQENSRIKYLHFSRRQGLSKLMKTGYRLADKEWVMMVSADGQFQTEDLSLYLQNSRQGDIIAGNRYNRSKIYSFGRRLISKIFNFATCGLYNINIHDVGWSKLVRKTVLNTIELKSFGAMVEAELVLKASLQGFKLYEVDTPILPRKYGKSKTFSLNMILASLTSMIFLYFELLFLNRKTH